MARYEIYAAAIDWDGLHLSSRPRAATDDPAEALRLASEGSNQGPEGAAIVCTDGRVIYTAEEYDAFRDRATMATESQMAYVRDSDNRVIRVLGEVEDGSVREVDLARSAPAGCSLVALECDATAGDTVVVDDRGVAIGVA